MCIKGKKGKEFFYSGIFHLGGRWWDIRERKFVGNYAVFGEARGDGRQWAKKLNYVSSRLKYTVNVSVSKAVAVIWMIITGRCLLLEIVEIIYDRIETLLH